jgi:drug/metabolite transporter (DMT)-like permease
LVGAAFEFAGAIIILTTSLRLLAVVAFVAGAACFAMGTAATVRR